MKLTKEQKRQATEKLLGLLEKAWQCRAHHRMTTNELACAISGFDDITNHMIIRLLRGSGKATFENQYIAGCIWSLTEDEARARFGDKRDIAVTFAMMRAVALLLDNHNADALLDGMTQAEREGVVQMLAAKEGRREVVNLPLKLRLLGWKADDEKAEA